MGTPSPLRALVLVIALLAWPTGTAEPTAPAPFLVSVDTPAPARAILAVGADGWDVAPDGWNASLVKIRYAVRAWPTSDVTTAPPPPPPTAQQSPATPPPAPPPLPPCLVDYRSNANSDGTLACSMALLDRNVALNGGSNPLTAASGGTETHPERAVDFSATGTWYESEFADGGQWIVYDFGDTFKVVDVMVKWTEAAYAPRGLKLSYGARDGGVSDVADPGYVTYVVMGAVGIGRDGVADLGSDDVMTLSNVSARWRAPALATNDAGYDETAPFDGAGIDARTVRIDVLTAPSPSGRVRVADVKVYGYAANEIPPSPPPLAPSRPPPSPPPPSPPPPDAADSQVLGSDVIAGCDEDDGYGTLRTKGKDEEDDNRDAWRFAVRPVLLPVKSTLVAWTCAPGFDVSPTVTTNVRTVANVPNISTYLPARNTTVFLAELEKVTAPALISLTSATGHGTTLMVSTRDVDDPDVAPQLTCDDAALGDQTLSSRGVTAVRYDGATLVTHTLATLGSVRVTALDCPDDRTELDPGVLFQHVVRVMSPTESGGAMAPAEVSASLVLSGGGVGVDEARSLTAQERIRRAVAWSLRRDGGTYGKTARAESVFLRSIRTVSESSRRRVLLNSNGAADKIRLDVVLSVDDATEAGAAATALGTVVSSNSLKNSLALEGIVVAVAGSVPVVRYSRVDSANCSLALGAVSTCATNDEDEGRGCPSAEDLGEDQDGSSSAACVLINGTGTSFFHPFFHAASNDSGVWARLNVTLNAYGRGETDGGSESYDDANDGLGIKNGLGTVGAPDADACRRWRNVSVVVPTGRFGTCDVDAAATATANAVLAAVWEPCPAPTHPSHVERAGYRAGAYCPAWDGGADDWFDPVVAIAFAGIIGGAVCIAVPVLWVRRRRAEMDAKGMSIDWEAMDLERIDDKRRIRLESLGLWPEGEARSARLGRGGGGGGGRERMGERRDGFTELGSRL